MKHILARANRLELERFAQTRPFVGLDFDGTLAPIVTIPARAAMSARTQRLLAEVAARLPTAVISGRARADLAARLGSLPLVAVVGNHGMEARRRGRGHAGPVLGWLRQLRRDLDGEPGIAIEDKGLSLAIHYRRSRAKARALAAIEAAVADLPDARIVGGKQVVNLVPRGAPHKGHALLALAARAGCHTALYVGDDDTDEDVFALPSEEGRLLTIRVGRHAASRAAYYLRHRGEVETLLRCLRDARQAKP